MDVYEESWENLTREKAFEGYVPENVCISLNPEGNTTCRLNVVPGEHVCRGQVIGETLSENAICVHASMTGCVEKIFSRPKKPGIQEICVCIRKDQEKAGEGYPFAVNFDRDTVRQAIYQSGLDLRRFETSEILVVNGFSNEPYITSGYRLMMESPGKIVIGAVLAAIATDAKQIYICINRDAFDAVARIRRSIEKYGQNMGSRRSICVCEVKRRYPKGNEKLILKEVLGKEKMSGRVVSLSEMAALYDGVYDGEAWTRVGITVSGQVASPKNLWVPIGTNIQDIIDYCGGKAEETVIVHGGPLGGRTVDGTQTWVTKETCGLLALKRAEIPVFPCIHCGQCRENCPQHLLPDQIEALYLSGKDIPENLRISDCIHCGLCSYVCPSGRRLTEYIGRISKEKGRKKRVTGEKRGSYIYLPLTSLMAKKLGVLELSSQSAPHIHRRGTIHDVMKQNMIALLPLIGAAFYQSGPGAGHLFLMLLVGVLTAGLSEYFWQQMRRSYGTLQDYSAVFTGLLLPLLFPMDTPLWQTFLAAVSAIIFGKQIFGGIGRSPIHPVIVGKILFSPYGVPLVENLWPLALLSLVWVLAKRMNPPGYGLTFIVLLGLGNPANLISASFYLGAAFFVWSYETMPSSRSGRWIFTLLSAVLTLIFQWAGFGTAGIFFAIACMDLTIPVLEIPSVKSI